METARTVLVQHGVKVYSSPTPIGSMLNMSGAYSPKISDCVFPLSLIFFSACEDDVRPHGQQYKHSWDPLCQIVKFSVFKIFSFICWFSLIFIQYVVFLIMN